MNSKVHRINFCWIILLINFISTPAYSQNLVAHYPFDNSAVDQSKFSNDGQIFGGVTSIPDRFGNACSALLFDGYSGYIEIPSSQSLESINSSFSIAVWYKLTPVTNNNNYWLTVVCKGASTLESTDNPQYRLQVQQNTTVQLNSCSPYNPTASSTISMTTKFTICDPSFRAHLFEPDVWHFYVLTYDGNYVRTYMDGLQVFEFLYTLPIESNKSSLFIGKDEPGNTEYFSGALDDLRIYNKTLSQNEINNLFKDVASSKNIEEFELKSPQNKVVMTSKNSCFTKVNFDEPEVITNCGSVSLKQTAGLASGSDFECGKHLITYTAESTSGYEQSCSFYIIVKDLIAPSLNVPNNEIISVAKGQKGIVYNYKEPGATDNCQIKEVSLIKGLRSGGFFPLGKTEITYTAIDNSNNKTTKSFYIEVKEKEEPVSVVTSIDSFKTPPVIEKITPYPKDSIQKKNQFDSTYIPGKDSSTTAIIEKSYKERKIEKERTIEVESADLLIELYDNGEIDGDTISLFLNNNLILSNQILGLKPISLHIGVDSLKDNELSLFAENLGSIPPNTALLILYDGNIRSEINLTSDMKTNGTIIIRRKKKQQ